MLHPCYGRAATNVTDNLQPLGQTDVLNAKNCGCPKLAMLGNTLTEKTPRSFDLDPEGRFLLAAGESSGKMAVYQIDADSGDLKPAATYTVGPTPWWVLVVRTAH